MTARCSWCVSPYRQVAEEAIATGEAVMAVSRRYGLSRNQWRHHKDHGTVSSPVVTSLAAVRLEVLEGGGGPYTVIPRLEQLVIEVQAAKEKWVEKPTVVLGFMRLERDLLGDVAKLRGEFPEKRSRRMNPSHADLKALPANPWQRFRSRSGVLHLAIW